MTVGHIPLSLTRVEVAAGTAFALLVALSRAAAADRGTLAPELRDALDATGDTTGECWLNLFGIPLDIGPPYDAARLGDAVEQMDPVDIRRHLLGGYAWSWRTLAGVETIEAAAKGDAAAGEELLAHERYYAGRAKASLSTLVRLGPDGTRAVLAHALDAGSRLLDTASDQLEAAAAAAESALEQGLPDAVERVTEGYRYTPEPEAERVLLIPHLEPEPRLVLAQHRDARLIVYQARAERGTGERIAALGRALADPKRVEILSLVARGTDRVAALVEATGLSRSTVHHHLGELRDARLVDLEGNARAYRYVPRDGALHDVTALLAEILPRGEA